MEDLDYGDRNHTFNKFVYFTTTNLNRNTLDTLNNYRDVVDREIAEIKKTTGILTNTNENIEYMDISSKAIEEATILVHQMS